MVVAFMSTLMDLNSREITIMETETDLEYTISQMGFNILVYSMTIIPMEMEPLYLMIL